MTGQLTGVDTDHLVALGDTGWSVWRWGLLRAAGFPADGVDLFTAPDTATVADAHLTGGADRAGFDAAFEAAAQRIGRAVWEIAGDPRFREAVTWQNPVAVQTLLDPALAGGPDARRKASRRQKENGIARYWSRYCAKNDTIGFFGPVCWVRVGDDAGTTAPGLPEGVTARPGPGLVRARSVSFERWALLAYADGLAADPAIRPYLPVRLAANVSVTGRTLRHPTRGTVTLNAAEAAVAARCDGRGATDLATAVAADPDAGVRRPDDALLHLEGLIGQGYATWGIDLPVTMECEDVLRRELAALADPGARERAEAGYRRLAEGRDAVADAAGDPVALRTALDALSATFTALTGRDPHQAAGQMYAGRTVCYEDTVRDIDVTIGTRVLDGLAAPLSLLLRAARWLSHRVAGAYGAELRAIYEELADEHGDVPMAELWYLAQGLLFGTGARPIDEVTREFTARWTGLLRLDADAHEVRLRSADLAADVDATFGVPAPGWAAARLHGPDVHLVPDGDRLTFVLGEMHAAWNTIDSEFFIRLHEDPDMLLRWQAADVPPGRLMPLLPADWPRLTPRTCAGLRNPEDRQLGFLPAPGADPDRLLPVTALRVAADGDDLFVCAPDGTRWPFVEAFAELLAIHTVDAFKMVGAFAHSPRVWIDDLVVLRETWQFTAGELDFVKIDDERARYLAVRRWRAELGLPERVFVKVATEVKPIYLDLTSPVLVTVACLAIRGGLRAGPDTTVTVVEMLPTPEQAWVPDAAGRRYASELRLLAVDPLRTPWRGTER